MRGFPDGQHNAQMQTEHHDLADSPASSYWPEHQDSPEDVWADDLCRRCREAGITAPPEVVRLGREAVRDVITLAADAEHRLAQQEAVTRFLQQVRDCEALPELQYFVACWQLAYEKNEDEDESQTAVARQFGVTRAAVQKRVKNIRAMQNPNQVSRGQKSLAARKVYELRQFIVGATAPRQKQETIQRKATQLWKH